MEGRPLDDDELVRRAQRGDVDGYELLVKRYQGIAHRVAYLVTGDATEAEDAAQSAFVKAYYALGRFERGRPFRPWLLRIVSNEARNRRRSAARRAAVALRLVENRPLEDAAPSPEGVVLAREPGKAILRALGEMREQDRLVIAYRYFMDMTEVEMAEALGCRPGTVKSRLSRALGRLRALLSEGHGTSKEAARG